MWQIELYNRRFDWLVAALLAVPLIWAFYGFDAAFISLLVFALVGGLKPLIAHTKSRLAAGVFAAGVVLLLSPLLRYIFYGGYCFDGVLSPGAGISRYLVPDLCGAHLFSEFGQAFWIGPLRDLAMPIAGLGLMIPAWSSSRQSGEAPDGFSSKGGNPFNSRPALLGWGILFLAPVGYGAGVALNYKALFAAQEAERAATIAQNELEAAQAKEEEKQKLAAKLADDERRKAAEKLAKAQCIGSQCRTLTPKGWAGIEAEMTVGRAKMASGLSLKDDHHYDGVEGDCRRYEVAGGPSDVSMLVEGGRVTSLTAWGGNFKTDRGVKIGDEESRVRGVYRPLRQESDIYGEEGDKMLFFDVGSGKFGIKFAINSGKVSSITVGSSSRGYVEGCL